MRTWRRWPEAYAIRYPIRHGWVYKRISIKSMKKIGSTTEDESMQINGRWMVAALLLSFAFLSGCGKSSDKAGSAQTGDTNSSSTKIETRHVEPGSDGLIPSGTG